MSESPYFLIDTDRFTPHESKAGNTYYKFNVYIRDRNNPPIWEGLLMGWRFQDGKLMPPFVGSFGRFYNSMYVSNAMAEAIYRHVVDKIATLEDIPVVAKPWEAAVVFPKNFKKMMPQYHETHFSGEKVIKKKSDGPKLVLFERKEETVQPEPPKAAPVVKRAVDAIREEERPERRKSDGTYMTDAEWNNFVYMKQQFCGGEPEGDQVN